VERVRREAPRQSGFAAAENGAIRDRAYRSHPPGLEGFLMLHHHIGDWSAAYANAANIAGADAWPRAWEIAAAAFRAGRSDPSRTRLAVAYGPHERQHYDLFLPEHKPNGLIVFIHGGYWLAFEGGVWSHLAAGSLERGFAVAIPTYRLCPEARISEITGDISAAITAAATDVDGPLYLTGHSAGGHLATRMITTGSPLRADIRARVRHTLSISGVHDLRPLIRTEMNSRLRLDPAEALAESPALLEPIDGARVTCWVGGAERAEFRRQNALLANVWTGLGAETLAWEEADRHHFNVVDGLAASRSALLATLLD
jgi:acetyl esterase/lipase